MLRRQNNMPGMSAAERLRGVLSEPGLNIVPGCHDALSARLVARAGFPFTFVSGFAAAAARLAAPDMGLLCYAECLDQVRNICEAVDIPVMADADTGFGNEMNVVRTVEGYARARVACIMLEDQIHPKQCSFVAGGGSVVPREEAYRRIAAAVDARERGAEILIMARTDAALSHGLDEGIERAKAFEGLGCDIVYVEGAKTPSDFERVAEAVNIPKFCVAVDGLAGFNPQPKMLDDLGYKILLHPVTLLASAAAAMRRRLASLKQGEGPADFMTWDELNETTETGDYQDRLRKYTVGFQE